MSRMRTDVDARILQGYRLPMDGRDLTAIGGGELGVDQVKRMHAFTRRHPCVTITLPRHNGSSEFRAAWTRDDDPDGIAEGASHYELRFLLDYLEARFDRGGKCPPR